MRVCSGLNVFSPALPANLSLLVAAIDLQVVRLIRGAIADDGPMSVRGVDRADISPRVSITPEPDIEPRRTITPEPFIEGRPVYHPDPAIEPLPTLYAGPAQPEHACRHANPIEPPWKVLPWEQPLPPAERQQVVKVLRYRPDRLRRGVMVDVIC